MNKKKHKNMIDKQIKILCTLFYLFYLEKWLNINLVLAQLHYDLLKSAELIASGIVTKSTESIELKRKKMIKRT